MPIVSSEIVGVINKPQGRKLIIRGIDDKGREWIARPNVAIANDDQQTLQFWFENFESESRDTEQTETYLLALDGKTKTAEYQSQPELDKSCIRLLMETRDSFLFSKGLQWFRDFETRAGANANSRANYLGVTSADYNLVATRFNQITGVKSGLEDDQARAWDSVRGWK